MKNYSFVIDDRAKDEIISAYLWYEEKQIGLGEKFMLALDISFSYITSNPKMFKKIFKHQRQAIVEDFPFVILYEPFDNEIVVFAIFHTAQSPSKQFRK